MAGPLQQLISNLRDIENQASAIADDLESLADDLTNVAEKIRQ